MDDGSALLRGAEASSPSALTLVASWFALKPAGEKGTGSWVMFTP
jgi:hypothetical protein